MIVLTSLLGLTLYAGIGIAFAYIVIDKNRRNYRNNTKDEETDVIIGCLILWPVLLLAAVVIIIYGLITKRRK